MQKSLINSLSVLSLWDVLFIIHQRNLRLEKFSDIARIPVYRSSTVYIIYIYAPLYIFQSVNSLEAAGQVFDLATDGSVQIRWASGQLTPCYPQDLYLLGEEVTHGFSQHKLWLWLYLNEKRATCCLQSDLLHFLVI